MLLGQPVDKEIDVGAAVRAGKEVQVSVFSGSSVLDPGLKTDRVETIERVLSPLAQEEVGTIRCIGLNVCIQAVMLSGRLALIRNSTSNTQRRSKWPFPQSQLYSCTNRLSFSLSPTPTHH